MTKASPAKCAEKPSDPTRGLGNMPWTARFSTVPRESGDFPRKMRDFTKENGWKLGIQKHIDTMDLQWIFVIHYDG